MRNARWETMTPEYLYVEDREVKSEWEYHEKGFYCDIETKHTFGSEEQADKYLSRDLWDEFIGFKYECDELQLFADGTLRLIRYS